MLLAGLPPWCASTCAAPTPALARGLGALRAGRGALAAPGGAGVLAKLAEVLVIESAQALRCPGAQATTRTGGLAGGRGRPHRSVPRLNALHARPAQAWTLEDLARVRQFLAARLLADGVSSTSSGSSPMQYLTPVGA
jgi:hypothetical protein